MATHLNPELLAGIKIGVSVSSVADRLRRITVQISGPEYSRDSGVIWHSGGHVITNAHAAKGRTHSVEFVDGRYMPARTVVRDAAVDLAALKVDLSNLPAACARSARELRAGELVIAIGNPWDGDNAVSTGIVHQRSGEGACIFANIRIALGNSGGPLADANGYVIGINSAIISGLACAVSSDAVWEFRLRALPEAV